eukprot:5484063-Amphidinium_carterae.3
MDQWLATPRPTLKLPMFSRTSMPQKQSVAFCKLACRGIESVKQWRIVAASRQFFLFTSTQH